MANIKINSLKIHIEKLTDNQMQEITGGFNYPGVYTYPTTWWPGLELGFWNRSVPSSIGLLGKR